MTDQELSTEQAAQLLNCTARTVRNLILAGHLPARIERINPHSKGAYKINKSDVEKLINQLKAQSSP